MRPVRLDITGFACFREPTVVDFTDADHFALVGPTGSGKSTVIDAMTFALYGSAPRWGRTNAVAQALAPTSNRCAVRLVFDLGGARYAVAREVRRVGKTVQQRNVVLERLPPGAGAEPGDGDGASEVLAGDLKEAGRRVEELLGLSFSDFCQCIVLPQGQFAEFLAATPKDRQEILLKLLGAAHYEEIGRHAAARASAAGQELTVLEAQLGELLGATDEALAAARAEEERLAGLAAAAEKAVPAITEAAQRVRAATDERDRLRGEHTLLRGLRLPDGLTELVDGLDRAERDRVAALGREDSAREADSTARAALAAGPGTARLEALLERHTELAELTGRREEISAAAEAAAQRQTRADEATRAAQRRHESADRAAGPLEQTRRTLTELVAAHRELTGAQEELTGATAAAARADRARQKCQRELEAARSALEEATRADAAAALRPHLVAGEPCPVCDQRVGTPPAAVPATGLAEARERVIEAERALTVAHGEQAALARVEGTAGARHRAATERIAVLESQLPESTPGTPTDGAPTLFDELPPGELAATRLAEVEKALVAAGDRLAEAERELAAAREAQSVAITAAARTDEAKRHLLTRLEDLTSQLTGQPSAAEATEALRRRTELEATAATAEREWLAARDARSAAERVRQEWDTRIAKARRDLGTARDRLVGLGAPEPAGASLAEDWAALLSWADDLARSVEERLPAAEERIAAATADADAAVAGLRELAVAAGVDPTGLADRSGFDPTRLPARLATGAERARTVTAQLVEHRARAATLTSSREVAQERQQVARLLADLLRSDRFGRWLAAAALDALVTDASAVLAELTGGQFELSHDRGEFVVIDHADADSRRSVRTLSGGETFQASLALALALSAQLSTLAATGAARLDSIFLDEGFGTLDPDTLEVVAGTLENLAHGERMVGVITHVPALAERAPVRFVVRRDGHTSTVTREES